MMLPMHFFPRRAIGSFMHYRFRNCFDAWEEEPRVGMSSVHKEAFVSQALAAAAFLSPGHSKCLRATEE